MHQARPLKSSTIQTTLSYPIQNYYSLSFRGMSYETISHLTMFPDVIYYLGKSTLLKYYLKNCSDLALGIFFFLWWSDLFLSNNKNICGGGGLENPRDGGAWWAAIYGVAQSWTWLKRLSSSSRMSCQCPRFDQTQWSQFTLLKLLKVRILMWNAIVLHLRSFPAIFKFAEKTQEAESREMDNFKRNSFGLRV